MLLAKAACDVLREPSAPGAYRAIAVVSLAEGVRQRIDLPLDAANLLWLAVERSPIATWAADATETIGLLAGRSLVEEIVKTVTTESASGELRRMGLDVFSDPRAAKHLTDREILGLVEGARGREAANVANVILAASEGRAIQPHVVQAIVARWSEQPDVTCRMAVLDLLELLPAVDQGRLLVGLLLRDPSSKVRELAAMRVEDVLDPGDAIALVDRALVDEEHPGVVAELTRARADALARRA